ncbi:MAG TPA: DUF1573 domain-containing protein [Thermoanaerobaculia bacterium]|nr:DUF1573 domain-containing protein [Thermoanaerobaculia bacterium]
MSNEFGTVSVRKGDRAREIDILRQQYYRHRESLSNMAAEAPSEHLAAEYHRLIKEIDTALGKLGELEGLQPSDTQPLKTEPGSRPLVTPPGMINPDAEEPATPAGAMPRVALIIAAGVVVLALIAWLLWRASGERPETSIRTDTATVTPDTAAPAPVTPAPKPLPPALSIDPPSQDYGTIRKGTRAVRQFQVTNNGDQPISLDVARSTCRCLYYDYATSIAPRARETITVTIDGAKAKAGALHETVTFTAKKDPTITGTFEVSAVIR